MSSDEFASALLACTDRDLLEVVKFYDTIGNRQTVVNVLNQWRPEFLPVIANYDESIVLNLVSELDIHHSDSVEMIEPQIPRQYPSTSTLQVYSPDCDGQSTSPTTQTMYVVSETLVLQEETIESPAPSTQAETNPQVSETSLYSVVPDVTSPVPGSSREPQMSRRDAAVWLRRTGEYVDRIIKPTRIRPYFTRVAPPISYNPLRVSAPEM